MKRDFIQSKDDHLANEVERVRTAAEATMRSFKVEPLHKAGDSTFIGVGVIKDKVSN